LIVEQAQTCVPRTMYAFAAWQLTDASSAGCVPRWSLIDLPGLERLPAVVNERPKQPLIHVPDADQLVVG
jgi:hypothetical protein